MTSTRIHTECPFHSVDTEITSSTEGKHNRTSTTRIISASIFPPAYPAIAPYTVPSAIDARLANTPTVSETRVP